MPVDTTHKKQWFSILLCGCIALCCTGFCVYYLSHSRQILLEDYLAAGGCFYRQQRFITHFDDVIKMQGNWLCIAAIPLCLLWVFSVRHYKGIGLLRIVWDRLKRSSNSYPWVLALLLCCIALAIDGHRHDALCTDEAFSALNFAATPVNRLLSYYPIPNNHVFFNLLNHFAALCYGNAFITGRVLSGIFYAVLICGNFFLLLHYTRNHLVAFSCCILLALQFLVWGFGHQARGYALCYLAEWGSFVAFYYYFFSSGQYRKEALTVLLLCNIAGTWTIPAFLYLLLFQVMAALVLMVRRQQWYREFWWTFVLSGTGIFLVYLPLLCYSGLASVLGNGHSSGPSLAEVWQSAQSYCYDLVTLQTFGFLDLLRPVALGFFILPFLLLLLFPVTLRRYRGLLLLYSILWLSVGLLLLVTRQFPVMRGIGFQMQVALLMVLLPVATIVATMGKKSRLPAVLFAVVTILCAVRMYHFNQACSATALYGQDTRRFFDALAALQQDFKPEDRIWLSDESFMWPFILKDPKNLDLYDCNFNNQAIIFLSEDDKPLPDSIMSHYRERNRAGWFIIYERR